MYNIVSDFLFGLSESNDQKDKFFKILISKFTEYHTKLILQISGKAVIKLYTNFTVFLKKAGKYEKHNIESSSKIEK